MKTIRLVKNQRIENLQRNFELVSLLAPQSLECKIIDALHPEIIRKADDSQIRVNYSHYVGDGTLLTKGLNDDRLHFDLAIQISSIQYCLFEGGAMRTDRKIALGLSGLVMAATSVPLNAAETITYKYDAKGRLTKVERTGTVNNGVNTEYTHDKADNRSRAKTTGSPNPPP